MKDKSNFFKLSAEERKQLQEDGDVCIDDKGNIVEHGQKLQKYLEDLLPCAYGYLKNIEKDIKEKELPHVMSIEAGFGSGKTHFVTRLCQYLIDNGIKAVYFNAFEYDNMNPKLAILDVISKNHEKNTSFNNLWQNLKNSISVNLNLGLGGCLIDLANLHLKDELQKIKEALQKAIEENERMVLIIDELDRCDPRFCMNLLETIKHFFDLDGLFTILSFSDKALLAALSNTYGLDFIKNNSENYLTKFIDHRTKIYGTDNISYSKVVSKFFQDNEVSKIDLERISIVFNGMKLSVREVKRCVERTISLMKSSYIGFLELYAYIACRYDKDFEKIPPIEDVYDPYDEKERLEKAEIYYNLNIYNPCDEKEQLFSKIVDLWNSFLSKCKYGSKNEKIRDNCIKIAHEFCIIRYVNDGIGYKGLQDDIRDYYKIICKDSGNAKKLAEFFLSDLFEKISATLENTQ